MTDIKNTNSFLLLRVMRPVAFIGKGKTFSWPTPCYIYSSTRSPVRGRFLGVCTPPCNSVVILLFLFLIHVSALHGQQKDAPLKHRISWTKDNYALRYEVIIEKDVDGEYSVVIQEFTEEPFIYISLSSGDYRLRVTPYDFRNLPVEGTDWKHFKVLPAEPPDEPVTPEPEDYTAQTEDTSGNLELLPQKRKPGNDDFYLALMAEGMGYSLKGVAFGGGLIFGKNFSRFGVGLSAVYAINMDDFTFLEGLFHFRYYPFYFKDSSSLFLQPEAGIVLIFYGGSDEKASSLAFSGGLNVGWHKPLGKLFYFEPGIRLGYPYLLGAYISAGISF